MNYLPKFAILAIVAGLVIGTASTVNPVAADKDSGSNGLEIADDNVHDNTGGLSEQDFRFHEGLCQGGHSTEALEEVTDGEGCDALDPPGNSGGNRQDE